MLCKGSRFGGSQAAVQLDRKPSGIEIQQQLHCVPRPKPTLARPAEPAARVEQLAACAAEQKDVEMEESQCQCF